jgi:hypothetical protein
MGLALSSTWPDNKQMQRTKQGQAGASPLICVFDGRHDRP